MTILFVLIAIVLLFFVLLFIKGFVKKRFDFCVICATISISWLALFVLYKLGVYQDKVLIGIFMGQTVVGLFYFLEKRLKDRFKVFALSFILSLSLLFYFILENSFDIVIAFVLLLLWIFSGFLYFYRENSKLKSFVNKLIECCRRW